MIAVDKKTGKLAWQVNDAGDRILDGQWSSPAVGAIGGVVQVVIGEGDGWVRGYEALTGKKLWEFDTNPKDSVWPKTRNEIISTPVIWQNKVFIANGQDPESGQGPGHLYAIDATKRGDITVSGRLWHYDKIKRSISTGAIANGLLFYADFTGYLHCLDVNTGQPYWTHDTLSAVWGSPMVIDGKVYLGDEDGDVLDHGSGQAGEADRHGQHGEQRLLHAGSSQRNPVCDQPEPAFRDCARSRKGQPLMADAAKMRRSFSSLRACLGAADDWPQFRGNPQLTGVATGSVPANLKLLWTYDAGESIESSAAISGGTVYVGSQSKDLLAIDLATGKLRWKYRATDSIGESSPAVDEGIVYVGDLGGVLHAVNAADGKGLWTFKTEAEIRSSPVIAGDRLLIGSYDGNLYCLSRRNGKLVWKFTTSSYVHGTPALSGGVAYVSGCDEVFHGIRLADGEEVVQFPAGGPAAASPAMLDQWAWFGNFNNEVVGASVRQKRILWRYQRKAAQFPFYSSAAAAGDRIVAGRPRQADPLPERQNRQGNLDVRHQGARRFLSRHSGRPRVHRFQRRPFLRARSGHRKEALGFRSRRAAFGFSGDSRGAGGDWFAGRAAILLRGLTQV